MAKRKRTALLVFVFLMPLMGQGAEQTPSPPLRGDSWAKAKLELRREFAERREKLKVRLARLRVVRRPETVLTSFPENPELFQAVTAFYDFLKGRELDVLYEQEGIPDFFPSREAYYDFLDTILPPMRERKFERNRLLDYRVHEIKTGPDPDQAEVLISITSDDILPFGKLMIFRQAWLRDPRGGWYPGKVNAQTATFWERVR